MTKVKRPTLILAKYTITRLWRKKTVLLSKINHFSSFYTFRRYMYRLYIKDTMFGNPTFFLATSKKISGSNPGKTGFVVINSIKASFSLKKLLSCREQTKLIKKDRTLRPNWYEVLPWEENLVNKHIEQKPYNANKRLKKTLSDWKRLKGKFVAYSLKQWRYHEIFRVSFFIIQKFCAKLPWSGHIFHMKKAFLFEEHQNDKNEFLRSKTLPIKVAKSTKSGKALLIQ